MSTAPLNPLRDANILKPPFSRKAAKKKKAGNDLLSQFLAEQVPSALGSLTSEFGMGSGVASPVWSPANLNNDSADLKNQFRRLIGETSF